MSSIEINEDVEMLPLRRSSRIAEKERLKSQQEVNVFPLSNQSILPTRKTKTSRKKQNENTKMEIDVKRKGKGKITKKQRKSKKVIKNINNFVDLNNTKINDLYVLIKKYSSSEQERKTKYAIIKTIQKERKTIGIQNLLTDLFYHRIKIERHIFDVLQSQGFTLIDITNHLTDIFSYREIDDLDSVSPQQYITEPSLLCSMFDKMNIEKQVKNDLDEINRLNSLICRLIM